MRFLWLITAALGLAAASAGPGLADPENQDLINIKKYLAAEGLPATTRLISDRMAMSIPMQIDGFTRLTTVNYFYPSTIVVHARVALTAAQIEEFSSIDEIRQNMRRDTVRKACSEPVMAAMLEAGMTMSYEYADDRQQVLFRVSASDRDCVPATPRAL